MKDLILKNVRLSFQDLHQVQPEKIMPDGSTMGGGYRAVVLLDKKDKEQLAALNSVIKEAAVAKFGPKVKISKHKLPYKDGDDSDRDEQQGFWVITAKEKASYPPVIVGRKNEVLAKDSGLPYSGCYVNVRIRPYPYSYLGNGVALSLKAVQFVKDGEPFGVARITNEDAFPALEVTEVGEMDAFLGGEDDDDAAF